MPTIGVKEFRGGETLRARVRQDEPRKLRYFAGYESLDGPATPDLLPTRTSSSALTGTIPAQVPLAFRNKDGVHVIARDSSEKIRLMEQGGAWGTAGPAVQVIGDNVPFRLGPYTVWAEDGASARLTAYEPDAGVVTAVSITAGGSGYSNNDVLTLLEDGASGCTMTATVTAGAVTSVSLTKGGQGYTVAAGKGTVVSPSGGTGCTIEVTAIEGVRPLSLKGPLDYSTTAVPTVTPNGSHPAAQLFDIVLVTGEWETVTAAATPAWPGSPTALDWWLGEAIGKDTETDREVIGWGEMDDPDYQGDTTTHAIDLTSAGVNIANKKYLVIDLAIGFVGADPNDRMTIAGEFMNSDQTTFSSGWELRMYSEQPSHSGFDGSHAIRDYVIPQISSNSKVNRVVIHLGDTNATKPVASTLSGNTFTSVAHGLAVGESLTFETTAGNIVAGTTYWVQAVGSADTFDISASDGGGVMTQTGSAANSWTVNVSGLGIHTSDGFVQPGYGNNYQMALFSSDFVDTWKFTGNVTLPAVSNTASPWFSELPPDPGTTGNSAVVLHEFAESFADYDPSNPSIRYRYCYRGRDAFTTTKYHPMISNPSNAAVAVFGDPWLYVDVAVTIPTNSSGDTVLDEYGDYVTDVLFYRSTFNGLEENADTGELGVWTLYEYIGSLPISESALTFTDAPRADISCTMNANNTITSTAHLLENGNVLQFDGTGGGVTANLDYYVLATPDANTFTISRVLGGTAVTSTLSSNTFTSTAHGLSVDDLITFDKTAGNIVAGTNYWVESTPNANTFTISASYQGAVMTQSGSDANVWRVATTLSAGSNNFTQKSALPEQPADYEVPQYIASNRAYADSARYAASADGRVYGARLTYDNTDTEWDRPLKMMVSNYEDFSGWPLTPTEDAIETDGSELGEFAPHAFEIRGLLVKNEVKFVFTDSGFFELIGRDAIGDWRFLRRDAIGCISGKTIADCRSQIIWHDGGHFYSYAGALAEPISDGLIDSSLIDFDRAHGWVFSKDRYVGFCYYADTSQDTYWCLMVYDLKTRSWRRRHAESYQLAGICVADASGDVYGLTHDGDIVNIFGGTADYGDTPVYTIDTQYIEVPGLAPGFEAHTSHVVLEAVASAQVSVEIDVYSQGRLNASDVDRTLTLETNQTYYGKEEFPVNLQGSAFRLVMVYRGTSPPDVHFLGLKIDDQFVEI